MSRTSTQTTMGDTVISPSSEGPLPEATAPPVPEVAAPSGLQESSTTTEGPGDEKEKSSKEPDDSTEQDGQSVPSGTNVSTNRFDTVKASPAPVLYQLEWTDRRNRAKPSFYSSTPFTNLNIGEDTVSAQYQSSVVERKQLVLEVITRIRGSAARDEKEDAPPSWAGGPPPPGWTGRPPAPGGWAGGPPPLPGPYVKAPDPYYDARDRPTLVELEPGKTPMQPAPYKLEEVAIKSIGSTRVVIHSAALMKVLRCIIPYYPMQNLSRNTTIIFEPYMMLIHHYAEIKAFSITGFDASDNDEELQHDENQVAKMLNHAKILIDFVEPHFHAFVEAAEDRLSRDIPIARYNELWYLFRPGVDVYFKKDNKQMAGVVIGCRYAETDLVESLLVKVWSLLFDGKVTRRKAISILIRKYAGEEEVTEFDVYPSKAWDIQDGGKRRKAFETRGEAVFRLCKNRFKQVYYNGKLTAEDDPATFKGLVIIDGDPISDYSADSDDSSVSGSHRSSVRSARSTPSSEYLDDSESSTVASLADYESDSSIPEAVTPGVKRVKKKTSDFLWAKYKNITVDSTDLTAHHYFLIVPFIEGFAVLEKKWKTFDIDFMSEVPRREEILDKVVMESTKQAIIRAISHPQSHTWKLDFIQGKGEGQIVLLHGPPGVGKTYTVECAAEATKRPLIVLTIADIGLDERRIEEQMTKWFNLAERWEAILLIDEADIFLERRRGADIARNGLVSVFLRKMEYFRGLLFLTTNRIGQIDDAFLSRIHVVIGYTPLDEAKRKRIWNGFFQKLEYDMKVSKEGPKIVVSKYAKEYVLNDEEVKNLKWNGREIRNAFQTAISLAGYEAAKDPTWSDDQTVDVQKDHFVSVVMMSREFHDYMDSITHLGESDRARGRYERNDPI